MINFVRYSLLPEEWSLRDINAEFFFAVCVNK